MAFQIVGVFLGICFFAFGTFFVKRRNQMVHTPTSKIRSLAMGLVEIKGKAIKGDVSPKEFYASNDEKTKEYLKKRNFILSESDISPFTKKKCVYCAVTIEQEVGSGKNRRWVVIHASLIYAPFYIQDDTGKILLDLGDAKLEISPTFEEQSGFGKDPSKVVMDYLKENKIDFEGFLGINKKMRYVEKAIFVGSDIYVIGEAMSSGKQSAVQQENIKIGKKGKWGLYYVSNESENALVKKLNRYIFPLFFLGGLSILLSALSLITIIK